MNQYYPLLAEHHALGEVFRYQDLAEMAGRLEARPVGHQERHVADLKPADRNRDDICR